MAFYFFLLANVCMGCNIAWVRVHMCAHIHESYDIMEFFLMAHHLIIYIGRASHLDSGLADMAGLAS